MNLQSLFATLIFLNNLNKMASGKVQDDFTMSTLINDKDKQYKLIAKTNLVPSVEVPENTPKIKKMNVAMEALNVIYNALTIGSYETVWQLEVQADDPETPEVDEGVTALFTIQVETRSNR